MLITTQPTRQVVGRSAESQFVRLNSTPSIGSTPPFRLWPHQQAALVAAHSAIRRGVSEGLWSMPTGTGKTVAFVTLARDLDWPTLILVHRDELVTQTVNTLEDVWPDASVGVVKAKLDDWHDDEQVVVASVQSLHNGRLTRIPRDRFELVVADEAHHAVAQTWRAVFDHFRHRFLLGTTAKSTTVATFDRRPRPPRMRVRAIWRSQKSTLRTFYRTRRARRRRLIPSGASCCGTSSENPVTR